MTCRLARFAYTLLNVSFACPRVLRASSSSSSSSSIILIELDALEQLPSQRSSERCIHSNARAQIHVAPLRFSRVENAVDLSRYLMSDTASQRCLSRFCSGMNREDAGALNPVSVYLGVVSILIKKLFEKWITADARAIRVK